MVQKKSQKVAKNSFVKNVTIQLIKKVIIINIYSLENIKWYIMIQKSRKSQTNICSCGKVYKYISGLYRHKKTCTFEQNNEEFEKMKKMKKIEKIEKRIEISEKNEKVEETDKNDYKEMFMAMMERIMNFNQYY